MQRLSKLFLFLVVLVLLFGVVSVYKNVSAKGWQFQKVNHVANPLEKIFERVGLFLNADKGAKAEYYLKLADKRLAEVVYLVENDKIGDLENVTSRYSTYLGTASEFLIDNKIAGRKEIFLKVFDEHRKVLEKLVVKYEKGTAQWMLVMHDINTIKVFQDRFTALSE